MSRKGPLSEEHKQKLQAGRQLAKLNREAGIIKKPKKTVFDKPVIQYTGNEESAFDFVPLVRHAFRKQFNYISSFKIVHDITLSTYWQNIDWIINRLSKDCIMEKVEGVKKVRKQRKPLTDEQRKVLVDRVAKARLARGKNE